MIEASLTSLLATKLCIPRLRRPLVARPRLLKQLDSGRAYPLTLVAAPAGFGKTTLLAQWAAQSGYPVAWLSLDAGDNGPARFWSYLIAAVETVRPGGGAAASAALAAPDALAVETVLTALINALASAPADFGLILDDYQSIELSEIHAGIAFLLDHAPASLHVIIATRADPLLPLARFRARHAVLEVRAADLRFSSRETSEFLQGTMSLPLSVEQVAALAARTEGWIAGLQLAALALGGQELQHIPDFVAASVGSNRFVIDYLVEEVMGGQEAPVQAFLCQTAILERLCPALCSAVTGREDSGEMLARLERTNLFLIRLDPEGTWYRYHNLFADVLRKLLYQRYPALVPELHRRAALWYAERHMMREAIGHALAIPDHEQAARWIEGAGLPVLSGGEALVTLEWLKALPPELVRSRPKLCLFRATAGIAGGEGDDVEIWLRAAEQGAAEDSQSPDVGTLIGDVAALRAILAARAGDFARVIDLADHALACLPATQVVSRGIASWMRGQAYEQVGETAVASQAFADTISASQAAENRLLAATALYTFAFLEFRQGRLGQARDLYRRALQAIDESDQAARPLAALISLGLGELLYQQDDLPVAQEYLERGLRLCSTWDNPDATVHGEIVLAQMCQARGDSAAGLALLDGALAWAMDRLACATLDVAQAERAHLWILCGNLAAAEQWGQERRLRLWQETGTRNQPMPRALELLVWARLLLARNQPAEALAVLEALAAGRVGPGWTNRDVRVLALSALAHDMQGERGSAQRALTQALGIAAAQGYVRVFADEGDLLIGLIGRGRRDGAWQDPRLLAFVERVLATAPPAGGDELKWPSAAHSQDYISADGPENSPALPRPARPVEALSRRELEVLRLVADGLGNRAIADRLIVSVGTVKSHIHNIYGKLGAEDRGQAVSHARALELL